MLNLGILFETPAFLRGRQAHGDGADQAANPYTPGSGLAAEWQDGWREAKRQETANANRALAEARPEASAEELGRAAAEAGLGASANPYHHGHPGHDAWRQAWVRSRAS